MNKTPQEREAARKVRHTRWLASFSDRDLDRILALADRVTPLILHVRLDDLDAPGIAVGVCMVGDEGRMSGERIGTLRRGEVAVLVWVKG